MHVGKGESRNDRGVTPPTMHLLRVSPSRKVVTACFSSATTITYWDTRVVVTTMVTAPPTVTGRNVVGISAGAPYVLRGSSLQRTACLPSLANWPRKRPSPVGRSMTSPYAPPFLGSLATRRPRARQIFMLAANDENDVSPTGRG